MKKILFAFTLLLFAPTSFATIELEGKILDVDDSSISIEEVDITSSGNPAKSDNKGFVVEEFIPPTAGNPVEIDFTHSDYVDIGGTITLKANGNLDYDGENITKEVIGENTIYTFDNPLTMALAPYEIIRGKISAVRGKDETEQQLIDNAITIHVTSEDGSLVEGRVENGEYFIKGYLGTTDKPRNYTATFSYPPYKDVTKNYPVKDKKLNSAKNEEDHTNIVFDVPTKDALRQRNIENITGFGCNELMPKYLVGANCVENSTLEGDASDIAMWIQKFGSKITGIISMIAVVLIVWNAFMLTYA